MTNQWIRKQLWIEGMMVDFSAVMLENALNGTDGIRDAKASYSNSDVWFSYDPRKINLKSILKIICDTGYSASEKPPKTASPKTDHAPRPSWWAAPANQSAPRNRAIVQSGHASGGGSDPLVRKVLKIEGMTCTNCEMRIENALRKTEGIREVKVSYAAGTAKVGYDPRIIQLDRIIGVIEKLDYRVVDSRGSGGAANGGRTQNSGKTPINQLLGIGIIVLAGYLILNNTAGFSFIPNVSQNMGFGILFLVGLVTSIHCVAMCGGINLSQAVSQRAPAREQGKLAKLKPSLMYNAGRVVSYTVLGGIVGALGSVVSFSGTARGIVSILAGVFMVIMGLNMLNIFPWLRRFTPHMPKVLVRKFHASGKHGPFIVGLFNGLMPCGPLQAMQIYALGTGSPVKGALSMLVFSLGTVPLMFGFGAISSFLSGKFTHKMMKVSATLVLVLGLVMLNRGFSLSGVSIIRPLTAKAAGIGSVATVNGGEQDVTIQLQANGYTPITVQQGIPVKWTIRADANAINGCNGIVTIPQYNISKQLQPGDNEIDFTPQQTGTISYTCSMGMINSTISVVDDVTKVTAVSPPASSGSSDVDVGVAKISGGKQSVTTAVGNGGYTPGILVVQKGVPLVISFDVKQLSSCNGTVVFPELGGGMDLSTQTSTPEFTPQSDFSFQCGMGMLSGYVKVVDDINKIDLSAIKEEAKNYVSAGGGMPCCQ